MSKGSPPKESLTHVYVFLQCQLYEGRPPQQANRVTQMLHTERELMQSEWAEWAPGTKSWSLASADREVAVSLKPGGYRGGTQPVAWKPGRALRVTFSTAKLQHWVARALSSSRPTGVEAPLILVSRWSFHPSVQTCGFGHSGALIRTFPLHSITSV